VGALEKDLPIAVACPCGLGVAMVAAGVVFRNEALVPGDNRERVFLVAVGRGLDAVLKEAGMQSPMVCCKGDSKRRLISSPVSRFVIQQSFSRCSATLVSAVKVMDFMPARISGAKPKQAL
jgi:hypothetical protein